MARPGVTYFDVANAAQQLMASGEEPTVERVRRQTKTGSNSTISAHLRAFRAKQDPLQQLATKEKIPEELIALLKGLWERVMAQAETQIEAIKNDTQQELSQHKQTIQQLQQDNARLKQSELKLTQNQDSLVEEKAALEMMITDFKTEIACLKAKQEGLVQQLEDKQVRIEELSQQNKQTQANLEHYRAASLEQRQLDQQRAEQQQLELTQAVQQLKLENGSLRQQKMDLQQSHNQLQLSLNSIQSDLTHASQYAEKIMVDLTEANKALAQKSESQLHWQGQHDKVYTQWEEQLKLTTDLQTQRGILSQQVTMMKKELAHMSEQNKVLAQDKWMLGQEKAQLFGQLKQLEAAL